MQIRFPDWPTHATPYRANAALLFRAPPGPDKESRTDRWACLFLVYPWHSRSPFIPVLISRTAAHSC